MRERYDLVFSLGAACACTECLRDAGLQFSSFPFDWLFGSTLAKRTDMLVDGCDDWLKAEHLEKVFSATAVRTDAYRNNATGITFNHDFPLGVPLADSLAAVQEKYDRRFARLRSLIARGGRVLAVYITPPKGVPPTEEEAAYSRRRLSERFPRVTFDVLVLRPDETEHGSGPRGCDCPDRVTPSEGVAFVTFDYRNRADTTGANPVDRDRVADYLRRQGYAAHDYRTAAERRRHRAAERAKAYRRFGATGPLDFLWAKCQYRIFKHLYKKLLVKGLV